MVKTKEAKPGSALALCGPLRELALRHGPGQRLPTRDALCRTFETSAVTLNNALKELERQNVITRRRGSGIFVSPALHQKHVLVLLESLFFQTNGVSPFWARLWGLCAERAQVREAQFNELYSFHLKNSVFEPNQPLPADVLRQIEDGSVHGVVNIGLNPIDVDWEKHRRLPMVSFAGTGRWTVEIEDEFWPEVTRSLAAKGCRAVGSWSMVYAERLAFHTENDTRRGHASRERLAAALADCGLLCDRRLIFDTLSCIENQMPAALSPQQCGYDLAMRYFAGGEPRPDGLYIHDDLLTFGALVAFEELGLQVGRDVHICTTSNAGTLPLFGREKQLGRLELDAADIADALFEMLALLMAGREPIERVRRVRPRLDLL